VSQKGRGLSSVRYGLHANRFEEGAQAEFNQLRDAYLPETVLAYITVLQFAGVNLTRDFLLEVMDMSARIAEDGSDLLELFMRTGRMKELVEVLALSSKALLITTSQRQSSASRSKKTRSKGWSQELWNVKT
jgi:nuclear pore complex protein Nup107